jgi:hypothetical protein
MHRITFYLFTTATLAAPVPALTQPLADDNRSPGRQVAMEICSACHRVIEGQPAPVENVPSFIAIANKPSNYRSFVESVSPIKPPHHAYAQFHNFSFRCQRRNRLYS